MLIEPTALRKQMQQKSCMIMCKRNMNIESIQVTDMWWYTYILSVTLHETMYKEVRQPKNGGSGKGRMTVVCDL